MKITGTLANLYCTRTARNDIAYRDWLWGFGFAGERLTGVNPNLDLSLARITRRWYRAGVTPYDAVKRWQRRV